jgi:3-hydroxy-9,10-secoandrosta-1,3,5(10)-triene-9,17-dione monooxygenase
VYEHHHGTGEPMNEAAQFITSHADALREDALPGDHCGNLTARTAQVLRDSGGFRLLLAKDLGGDEAHPVDFVDWVIAVGAEQPSAGWIAGVVGVHPWEISFMDPRVQQEIYGADPDTWVASPYAPFGRATPVEGGYLFSGDWPYSTGTDYCDWVILGGIVQPSGGEPSPVPDVRHFVLPRGDYEIVEESWNVMGLKGTGSKNVRMEGVFVPDYRVYEAPKVTEGVYAAKWRPDNPLYAMMFGVMFPAAIAAGTLGIAKGALRAQQAYMAERVSVMGNVAKTDPAYLSALAVAEADLEASELQLRHMLNELFEYTSAGHEITPAQRLRFRRNQVRATDRVFHSYAPLARMAGSAGIQEKTGLERWWRDLQTAISHIANVEDNAYVSWGLHNFGGDIPPTALY